MLNVTQEKNDSTVRPLRHLRYIPWLIWGIAASFVFYQFLLQVSSSVMIQPLMESLAIDVSAVGLISSAFYYTYVVLQMPAGMLVDRFGAKRLLIIGLLGISIASYLFATANTFGSSMMSRMLMGIVATPGIVSTLYLASRWFSPKYFALLAGLTEMVGMLGAGFGQPVLSMLVQSNLNWRGSMMLFAIVGIVLLFFILFIVRDHPSESMATKLQTTASTESACKFSKVASCILLTPHSWVVGVFSGLMFSVVITFAGLWGVPYIQQLYQVATPSASSAMSMVFIGAGIGSPLIGWCSGCIGRRCSLMMIGTVLTLLCMLIVLYCDGVPFWLMFIVLFLAGFFSSVYMLPFAVMGDLMPSSMHAAAMGFTNMMCLLIPAPLLQPLIGFVLRYQHKLSTHPVIYSVHDYRVALSVLTACIIVALVLLYWIPETYCRRQEKK